MHVEGKIAAGLDEFMLRLGHLKLLCRIAQGTRASRTAIQREMASALKCEVVVPSDLMSPVAHYLFAKRLCQIQPQGADGARSAEGVRYPNLRVVESARGIIFDDGVEPKVIWQQDLWLADPKVRSRVGAVTLARGKGASKTGLSHILDWAEILELLTASGSLTPLGHLLAGFSNPESVGNPYVIGQERIILAYALSTVDFDIFVRMIAALKTTPDPIAKKAGVDCFRSSVRALSRDADLDHALPYGRRFRVAQLAKEVGAKSDRVRSNETDSTAWHRASSRLESFVDLGLLTKDRGGERERYQYIYYVHDRLRQAAEALLTVSSCEDWTMKELVNIFGEGLAGTAPEPTVIMSLVPLLAKVLGRPPSLLPISSLSLGLAMIFAQKGQLVSLGSLRKAVEDLAKVYPEHVRLSRGSSGERAEVISIDVRGYKNGPAGSEVFH